MGWLLPISTRPSKQLPQGPLGQEKGHSVCRRTGGWGKSRLQYFSHHTLPPHFILTFQSRQSALHKHTQSSKEPAAGTTKISKQTYRVKSSWLHTGHTSQLHCNLQVSSKLLSRICRGPCRAQVSFTCLLALSCCARTMPRASQS